MGRSKLRLLLIDDDEDDYVITQTLLTEATYQAREFAEGIDLEWVSTYELGLAEISRRQHDVYLIDYYLGANNGLDLVRTAIKEGCTAPLILLTGQNDRMTDIEAMRLGAADYLVKAKLDAPLLERSIRYAFERKRSADARADLEAKLRQTQRMEAVGRLAGGIAHDFNNMLTAIMGYAGMALDGTPEDDPIRSDIQGIQKTAQRAAGLTRQLLAFSRRQVAEPQTLNINDLITNMDKLLSRLIGKEIEFITLLAPNLGRVKIDPSQFEQVLINLVTNAQEALPNGGRVVIETGNVILGGSASTEHLGLSYPDEYVLLAVKDNGIGISESIKDHIFEPFFTTKEVGYGAGLGLATSFGIVNQNNGFIDVDSTLNEGTTIKVYLPRVEEILNESTKANASSPSAKDQKTILLVEDEPAVRKLVARVLQHEGYNLLEATNGQEGLDLAQSHQHTPINLLITDLVMPQMGGKVLAEQLRVMRPNLKVLFISGYTNQIDNNQGEWDLPEVASLNKPFSPVVLIQCVRELLDTLD